MASFLTALSMSRWNSRGKKLGVHAWAAVALPPTINAFCYRIDDGCGLLYAAGLAWSRWNFRDKRTLVCALPAIRVVACDDAAPGGKRLVVEDNGGAACGRVGQEPPARGQHGALVAA